MSSGRHADGSARFLSAKIDPTVLEHLATAAGGETVPPAEPPTEQVVHVEPEPSMPPDSVPPPEEMQAPDEPEEPAVAPVAEGLRELVGAVLTTNVALDVTRQ